MFRLLNAYRLANRFSEKSIGTSWNRKQNYCTRSGNVSDASVPTSDRKVEIDDHTIALLEQLSLVDCANKESVNVLEDSIRFANKIDKINVHGVEPMYTVLEDRYLYLRKDKVTEGNCQKQILSNASVVEEDYFVAPPGNISVTVSKKVSNAEGLDDEKLEIEIK